MFADVIRSYSGNFSGFPRIYNFHDGSNDNRALVFGTSNTFSPIVTSAGASQLDFLGTGAAQFPAPNRIAHALKANSSRLVFNGVATTEDTTVTMPVGINTLAIGSSIVNLQWNGPVKRFVFWSQAFSASTLKSITQ